MSTITPVSNANNLSSLTAAKIPPQVKGSSASKSSAGPSTKADEGNSSATGNSTSSSSSTSAPSSVTVALSDGTLETITTNSDGSQTTTYSDPSHPPQGTSGSVITQALDREAAHKNLQQGGFAFVNSLVSSDSSLSSPQTSPS